MKMGKIRDCLMITEAFNQVPSQIVCLFSHFIQSFHSLFKQVASLKTTDRMSISRTVHINGHFT